MFRNIIPLITGLALAGGLSQFPEFAQQYTQRVGGAYTELRGVADGFRVDAKASGKTVEQAIDEYFAADSQFFNDRGTAIQGIIHRESYLERHYQALTAGSAVEQLLEFGQNRDMELAGDTLAIYQPAMPLTATGAVHAGVGFFTGFLLLRFPFLFRRRKGKETLGKMA